ncbi:4-phosphoerythronate dehydrogenase [Nocardia seriolae]|uniref:hypothetical protein n=1 Tax=Nocardia seriolae TaxID=37332 RepID=UPI0003F3DD54|nr:hypothetical protein [Nocardia seriolae]BEK92989.1 hypothetical protein NSER024013_08950 [Nocardia seriolae]GAM44261.1 4-phosphoerythronate dehydrogenase [Nocardia seriolae]
MSYIITEGSTAVEHRSGHGHMQLHWHQMPLPTVRPLEEDSSLGDIEIRWRAEISDGVKAHLNLEEARALRQMLDEAIVHVMARGGAVAYRTGDDNGVVGLGTVKGDGTGTAPEWVSEARENGYPSPREALGISESGEASR